MIYQDDSWKRERALEKVKKYEKAKISNQNEKVDKRKRSKKICMSQVRNTVEMYRVVEVQKVEVDGEKKLWQIKVELKKMQQTELIRRCTEGDGGR